MSIARKTLLFGTLVLAGCGVPPGPSYDGAFVEEGDLLIRTPQLFIPAASQHDTSVGDAYLLLSESASQLNAWTLNPLRRLSPLVERARDDEGSPDGGGWIWGPYPDPIQRQLTWQVWGDGSVTELRVRDEGSEDPFETFWRVEVEHDPREVSLRWNADLVASLPELAFHLHDTNREYAGAMTYEMARNDAGKSIAVRFEGFTAIDPGFGDFTFDPRADLVYEGSDGGAGSIAFARADPYTKEYGFTGPAPDVLTLESVWADAEHGFARLTIAEAGPANPEGDPLHGALESQECFDSDGLLVWRDISQAYLAEDPDFQVGAPSDCSGENPWPALDD